MKSFLVSNADHKKVKQKSADLDIPIHEIVSYLINTYLDEVNIPKSIKDVETVPTDDGIDIFDL